MLKVSIDKLDPAMKLKLAKPVIKGNMILVNKDIELTENLINKIQNMGIDCVYIDVPTQQSISKEEALEQLDWRFKKVEDKPYMNMLKKLIKEHIEGLYD